VPLDTALEMIERGEIMDGKTIMLLQHVALKRMTQMTQMTRTHAPSRQ
jgi:hypothetical protein